MTSHKFSNNIINVSIPVKSIINQNTQVPNMGSGIQSLSI